MDGGAVGGDVGVKGSYVAGHEDGVGREGKVAAVGDEVAGVLDKRGEGLVDGLEVVVG